MENKETMGLFLRGIFVSSSERHNQFLNCSEWNVLVAVGSRAFTVSSLKPVSGTLGEFIELPVYVRESKGKLYYSVPREG